MTARPGSSGGAPEWDSLGRLARVRLTPGGTIVAAYTYDALDRLITVDRSGTRIRFRYAGTTTAPAQVIDDATLTVIRNVAVGPEGTVLLDWLGADRRLYGTNAHHDTTWTADDTGAVTATLRYDPWGNVLRSSGTLPDWRFQGSWADTSTNLAWSVARWYDPVQGAFISEDALLGDPANPGSRHLYAYGAGEPVGAWDPSGQRYIRAQRRVTPARAALVQEIFTCSGFTFGGRILGDKISAQGFTFCTDNIGFWNVARIRMVTVIDECGWDVLGLCWGGWNTLKKVVTDDNTAPAGFVWFVWSKAIVANAEPGALYRIMTTHIMWLNNPREVLRGVTGRQLW